MSCHHLNLTSTINLHWCDWHSIKRAFCLKILDCVQVKREKAKTEGRPLPPPPPCPLGVGGRGEGEGREGGKRAFALCGRARARGHKLALRRGRRRRRRRQLMAISGFFLSANFQIVSNEKWEPTDTSLTTRNPRSTHVATLIPPW